MTRASTHTYTNHVYFPHFLSKRERGETNSELSSQPNNASDFCLELRVGSAARSLLRLCGSLYRREFWFCARWAELRIFVNKNCKKTSTVSCFCLTKQKESVVIILLALQSNLAGANQTRLDRSNSFSKIYLIARIGELGQELLLCTNRREPLLESA